MPVSTAAEYRCQHCGELIPSDGSHTCVPQRPASVMDRVALLEREVDAIKQNMARGILVTARDLVGPRGLAITPGERERETSPQAQPAEDLQRAAAGPA